MHGTQPLHTRYKVVLVQFLPEQLCIESATEFLLFRLLNHFDALGFSLLVGLAARLHHFALHYTRCSLRISCVKICKQNRVLNAI